MSYFCHITLQLPSPHTHPSFGLFFTFLPLLHISSRLPVSKSLLILFPLLAHFQSICFFYPPIYIFSIFFVLLAKPGLYIWTLEKSPKLPSCLEFCLILLFILHTWGGSNKIPVFKKVSMPKNASTQFL